MGRAIVRSPQAFLFDEPLSNLDAKLRVQMRTEIKALHQRLGTTTVYVTHDQVEAMTMADRIVVLKDGVDRAGRRAAGAVRPAANAFVAGFIGSPAMNFIPGRLQLLDGGAACADRRRPEPAPGQYARARAWRPGVVRRRGRSTSSCSETQIAARLGDGHNVIAAFRDRIFARPGDQLSLRPQAGKAHLFDAVAGKRLN
jgi:multiple sugar transport system ATP-binding protein